MKYTPLIALVFFAPSALAMTPYKPHASHYLSGFYAKMGLGGTIAQYDFSQQYNNTYPAIPINENLNVDHNSQGTQMAGLIGFGYSYQLDALWIIGAEFTAGFTGANASYSNTAIASSSFTVSSKNNATLWNDFAILLKPGLVIQQRTQFYALLGPRWGNFETSSKAHISDAAGTDLFSSSHSNDAYTLGFTVGLGVERLITQHWSLGLEYAYTTYGDIPSTHIHETSASGFVVNNKVTASSSSSNLLLEANYRF